MITRAERLVTRFYRWSPAHRLRGLLRRPPVWHLAHRCTVCGRNWPRHRLRVTPDPAGGTANSVTVLGCPRGDYDYLENQFPHRAHRRPNP